MLSRAEIKSTLNSFNNACFERVESIRVGDQLAVCFHFVASDFALMGIKRILGGDFIKETSEGYYFDYVAYRLSLR